MPETSWIAGSVQAWVAQGGNILVPEALYILRGMGIAWFAFFGFMWALHAASGNPYAGLPRLARFIVLFTLTLLFLHDYSSPLPWSGFSFHQIIPESARRIQALINTESLQAVTTLSDRVVANAPAPTFPYNFMEVMIYAMLWLFVWLMQGILFALSSVGFVGIGIGIVMGPLLILWLPFGPRGEQIFFGYINYMVTWSFFQVVASALVFIWCQIILAFFAQIGFGGNTLIQDLVLVKAFFLLNIALIWSCTRVDKYTGGLFGNAIAGASEFSSWAVSKI